MPSDYFFYGTLRHLPLLSTILQRKVEVTAAHITGWRAHWAKDRPHPMLVEDAAGMTEGVLVRGLTKADEDRLDFYEGGFDYLTRRITVSFQGGTLPAKVYFTAPDALVPGAPWDLKEWAGIYGAEVVSTAADVMALYGKVPAEDVLARYPQMLVRGASRVRARQTPPTAALRRSSAPSDVQVQKFQQPYAHFFAVEEYDLSFRQFSGAMSKPVNRATFISGDAVTVLPYDLTRDRVLVVEQFRAGPFARGDLNPWSIEAIAGRIDPAETAEDCARREALEEAGLHLDRLLPVADFYPSPGAKSEYLYSYVALTDLPDGVAGVFGVEYEAEDIRGHLIGFDRLMALVASGEINNGPLILTALWLQRERPRLRGISG